jgi:hypothetical protein
MKRRTFLAGAGLSAVAGSLANAATAGFLEARRNTDGGYGWSPGELSHVTPTFAAVGCYTLLGEKVPAPEKVAEFVASHYPVPDARRTDRPLWRFDFEQAQTLKWLERPVTPLRALAETWTKPAVFTNRYELNENPVFQHQAMAVCTRKLAGIDQAGAGGAEWRAYFAKRRRANGSYNHTPAADGTGGHLTNTVWGLWAVDALDETVAVSPELAAWAADCQLPSGGFTYAPGATLGAVDDVMYTWAALWLLDRAGKAPRRKAECVRWLASLAEADGGYMDRPGGVANPTATYYALECFRLLKTAPQTSPSRAAAATRHAIPPGARVFTIQVEAPGTGSPADAVTLAEKLGIHIWTAKNCAPGWIAEAQRIANTRKAPVLFGVGDEEYGTYLSVPALGTYSHLVDLVAPAGDKFVTRLDRRNVMSTWAEFRDTRVRQLRASGGRLIWQFNENEELTRAMLDEAAGGQTYSAIASHHFGREYFLETQPYLQRWIGRLPMVGLQDAHGIQPWWWADWLVAFRTVFIAREPSWEGWLGALERNHVTSVRRDAATSDRLQIAGVLPHVREFLMAHQDQWAWWGKDGAARERPPASLAVLRPGTPFEAGAPAEGVAVRLRLWADNTGQGTPRAPRTELVSLQIDGRDVTPREVASANDRYLICPAPAGARQAVARVRALESKKETLLTAALE